MYRIVNGSTKNLADVESFVTMLNNLPAHPVETAQTFFDLNLELFVARAPGRLDVMGGIADYSGSLVLQLPVAEATLVALQPTAERKISILSLPSATDEAALHFEMSLAEFEEKGATISYEDARRRFRENDGWAAYVAGAFLVLMRERHTLFSKGARIMITSGVPKGKGVSSSAALEVATMMALAAAFDISISPIDIALLCQRVENLVVGAACGVMDQMTSVCAETDQFLRLRCQPAVLEQSLPIPEGVSFVGIDSGIRHSVSGSDYTGVRVGAYMGYRIIAESAGLQTKSFHGNTVDIDDPKWRGYLANISPSEFEQLYSGKLPVSISGREFLDTYKGTTDTVTKVDPERTYAVHAPTAHPVYENVRVEAFAKKMAAALSPADLRRAGELMYQSHDSYSACGLGSSGTNLLVEIARNSALTDGVYGAKITGGGGGGTVAIMCDSMAVSNLVDSITDKYHKQTGYRPYVFRGTSMGAVQFGHLRLKPASC